MDVFSKELVYKKGQKYKAYLLFGTTAVDVATLGFTELIDIETTKGTDYSSIPCRYVILNGKLFYSVNQKFRQVNNWTTWTYISGNYDNNSNALGIADGKLYRIYTSNEAAFTVTQIGNLTTWTKISGYDNSYRTYGITVDGKLYMCSGTSQSQVGTGSNWTDITGYSTGSSAFAYGIHSGRLSSIGGSNGTTVRSISSLTTWTKISGYSIGTLGIADGKLYKMTGSSQATQIGDLTTWTKISSGGVASSGYGIADGKLYKMSSSQTSQVGTLTNWTDISGFYGSPQCAYGIAGDKLYYLSSSSATQLLNSKCLAVFGAGSTNYPALAICEV